MILTPLAPIVNWGQPAWQALKREGRGKGKILIVPIVTHMALHHAEGIFISNLFDQGSLGYQKLITILSFFKLFHHHFAKLDVYISFTEWNVLFKVLLCNRRISKQWRSECRQHSTNHVRLINRPGLHTVSQVLRRSSFLTQSSLPFQLI